MGHPEVFAAYSLDYQQLVPKPNPLDYLPEKIDFTQTNKDGEWRDLFAHDVLRWNGFGFSTRSKDFKNPDGTQKKRASSPDLAFQRDVHGRGFLWEIKSPTPDENGVQSKFELNFIGNALQKAVERNFSNPHDIETNEPVADWDGKSRVVLNLLYRPVNASMDEIIAETKWAMDRWHVHEVLIIDYDGNIRHIN